MNDNSPTGKLMERIMIKIKDHLIPDTEENLKTENGFKPMHYNQTWNKIQEIIMPYLDKNKL